MRWFVAYPSSITHLCVMARAAFVQLSASCSILSYGNYFGLAWPVLYTRNDDDSLLVRQELRETTRSNKEHAGGRGEW